MTFEDTGALRADMTVHVGSPRKTLEELSADRRANG
jgi:hypothetical protein